jgi:uncharacterized protein (DUF3084 family)
MRERLEQRLAELRADFERGQQTLDQLETQATTVRQTLLRISGAIQVLEEELNDTTRENSSELSVEEDEPVNETGSATTSRRG